jgi:hypothetical protein
MAKHMRLNKVSLWLSILKNGLAAIEIFRAVVVLLTKLWNRQPLAICLSISTFQSSSVLRIICCYFIKVEQL